MARTRLDRMLENAVALALGVSPSPVPVRRLGPIPKRTARRRSRAIHPRRRSA